MIKPSTKISKYKQKLLNTTENYYFELYKTRHSKDIENNIKLRSNLIYDAEPIPISHIIEKSLQTYFSLLKNELGNLKKIFNIYEIIDIFDHIETPSFCFEINNLIIDDIAECLGVENWNDFFDDYPEYQLFINKLLKLTPLQNAALVDFCERFLIQSNEGAFLEKLEKIWLCPSN